MNGTEDANYISYDEFAVVVRRMDRMEYSIGNVVARVCQILNEIFIAEC